MRQVVPEKIVHTTEKEQAESYDNEKRAKKSYRRVHRIWVGWISFLLSTIIAS